MGIPVSNNRYSFPSGYRGYVAFSGGAYAPWNGYNNGANTPSSSIIGAVLQFLTTGVPTDSQTLTFIGPDGKLYSFQFLYNATGESNPLAITVRLTASGSSTAAQVMTALLAILALPQAITQGGVLVKFPWTSQAVNATTSRLNFNQNGNVSASVTPANMTVTTIAQPTIGQTGISPAKSVCAIAGRTGAFLPGP